MGTLHIVATPIGNLEDVTLRALRVLREADWVLAEDTRRTRILLDHFEIAKTPTSLHAHNEAARIDQVLAALADARSVALVSDAGTPLVSDPGARLVAAVAAAGHRVEAVPGASAMLSALCVAGLDTQQVLFLGFLPRKRGEQTRLLERQRGRPETIVLFESPHRVAATFAELARVLGDRPACLARELTKRHEEVLRGSLSELAARCEAEPPRGECTLVVAGAGEAESAAMSAGFAAATDADVDAALTAGLGRGESVRDLASAIAARTGRGRREVYARALVLRSALSPEQDGSDGTTSRGDAGRNARWSAPVSGGRSVATSRLRLPTLLRTLRPLRFRQAVAQIQHALFGVAPPRSAPGGAPRLAVAAPCTPWLSPAAHVRSFGSGRFELLATPFEAPSGAAWSSAAHGPLFAYHLHQHEYLRCDGVPPAERAAVIADWIRTQRAGIGWDPHPTGLRLLAWGKLATTAGMLSQDEAQRVEMLRSFADQAETLSRNLEIRLQANHLLANLLCVVFAGLLVESAASAGWRRRAGLLCDELAAQIRPDGGHEERSPMYHALLLENVLDLLNLCRAVPTRAPAGLEEALAETAGRMLGALEVLSHGDGHIALFADSALDVAAEPSALRDYAERLGVGVERARGGSVCLPQSGYVRLESGAWLLIASVAAPSPPHQPGHAHCDALAFELSVADRRLVTDTGLFEYVVGPRRHADRATASHSTLQIDGEEQAEIWAAHRIGGRPEVELTAFSEAGEAEATCRGWSRRRTLHRRHFRVTDAGVEIEDSIEGPARALRTCLPIGPGWAVELRADSSPRALCRSLEQVGLAIEIELPAAFAWRLEHGAYHPSFGRELERPILVGIAGACSASRTRFRRIG